MSFRSGLLIFIVVVMLSASPASAASKAAAFNWVPLAPGIDYTEIHLTDPINIFVARMDRANPSVTLDTSIAQGKFTGGREAVSDMFSRYDQALNFWGGSSDPPDWGMRNQVVVAINGSYFDFGGGYMPTGLVQSGWYIQRYEDFGGWSGFAWNLDRSPSIGECVYRRPEKQLVSYPATSFVQALTNINTSRGSDQLILYTPQYDVRTGTDNNGVEVLLEMTRPSMIMPWPAFSYGYVRRIAVNEGNSLIPFNSVVLSATGKAAETLLQNVQLGAEVNIHQEITSLDADCVTSDPLNWTKTYASLQGAFFFLKNGEIRDFEDSGARVRNPRTAIAYNDQYVFFIVVDGRDLYHSLGMTIHELALFTRNELGANYGVAQDGGGSSTMVVKGHVVNNTYCNNYTCGWNWQSYAPDGDRDFQYVQAPINLDVTRSSEGVERPVANGMLMVVTQPAVYSPTFKPGDPVTTLSDTDVRLGPSWDHAVFAVLPPGTPGIVVDQMNGLNGVLSKDAHWWYVDFAGVTGWVTEGMLAAP